MGVNARTYVAAAILTILVAAIATAGAASEDYAAYLDDLYRDTVPVIHPSEVGAFLEDNPGALVIDVRSEPERTISYIDGSQFHDFDTFDTETFRSLPRDTPILAYCAVGYRSERVGERLLELGFTNVFHIYGGIIEWHNQGLPLEPGVIPAEDDRPAVHGYLPRWGKYVVDGNVVYDPPVR